MIRPYLAADPPRLRRAAMSALGRLSPKAESGRLTEELLEALEDPFASVAKAAREVIVRNRLYVPAGHLGRIALRAEHPHTLRVAVQLLHSSGKWPAIEVLVRLAGQTDGEQLEVVHHQIDVWLGKATTSFVKPTPEEATVLRQALQESAGRLGGEGRFCKESGTAGVDDSGGVPNGIKATFTQVRIHALASG